MKHLAANGYVEGISSVFAEKQVTVVPGIVDPHQKQKGVAVMNKGDECII